MNHGRGALDTHTGWHVEGRSPSPFSFGRWVILNESYPFWDTSSPFVKQKSWTRCSFEAFFSLMFPEFVILEMLNYTVTVKTIHLVLGSSPSLKTGIKYLLLPIVKPHA